MSLDTVELVMEMEETFDIVIEDLDAEHIGTVGQAYRYILSRVALSTTASCRSAAHFYRFRRALMARTGTDRRSIRPDSRLADLLPESGRREAWVALGDAAGLTMPGMDLGVGLGLVVLVLSLIPVPSLIAVWGTLGAFSISWLFPIIVGSFVLWIVSATLMTLAFQPFATKIPDRCRTIRGVILATLGQRPEPSEGVAASWHPDEVWAVLRDLIAEQVGVSRAEVTEEKHFVYDLGMD